MSKTKILLASCQQNLLRCEVKIAQIPMKQKQNICWKQIRTFSTTIECDNTIKRHALKNMKVWKAGVWGQRPQRLVIFTVFKIKKRIFRQLVLNYFKLLWRAIKECVVRCCLYLPIALQDRMLLRMQDFHFVQI